MQIKTLHVAIAIAVVVTASTVTRADWLEARTQNFAVIGDWSEKRLVDFAKRVEHFDQVLRMTTSVRDGAAGPPVRILVLRDGDAVRELRGASQSSQVEGFYRVSLRGPLAVINRERPDNQFDITGEAILFHELTHHFMFQQLTGVYPNWYVEGFAEYHSTVAFTKNGDVEVGLPPRVRLPSLMLGRWLPVERMLNPSAPLTNDQVSMLYSQGWLLTHYVFGDPDRTAKFREFLRLTQNGVDGVSAWQQAFQRTPQQMDTELRAYFGSLRRHGTPYRRFAAVTFKDPTITVRKLSAGEIDALELDARLSPRVPTARYADLQARAAALIAKHPTDPFALTIAAETAFATEQFAEAEGYANRALAASPQAQRALAIKGAAQLHRSMHHDSKEPIAISTIRSTLVRANRANPDDPMALYYFFRTFEVANQKPTDNAVSGLLAAYQLAPRVSEVRLTLAHELIRQEKLDKAAIVLRPLAFSPHGGDASRIAHELLTKISKESVAQPAVVPEAQEPAPSTAESEGGAAKPN